jgi:hypothetical protein
MLSISFGKSEVDFKETLSEELEFAIQYRVLNKRHRNEASDSLKSFSTKENPECHIHSKSTLAGKMRE